MLVFTLIIIITIHLHVFSITENVIPAYVQNKNSLKTVTHFSKYL